MKPERQTRIAMLEHMDLADLRDEYFKLFGEVPYSANRRFLRRRIAWRIQYLYERTDQSPNVYARAEEIADLADMRVTAPLRASINVHKLQANRDPRLPLPGTVIEKKYRNEIFFVTVLPDGFQFKEQNYRSLSAVAKAITGSHWNGFKFFGLTKGGKK